MLNNIINYIRAGYSGLCLVSAVESRVDADMKEVAQRLERPLYVWSSTTGLVHTGNEAVRNVSDPVEAVGAVMDLPEDAIVILHDLPEMEYDLPDRDTLNAVLEGIRENSRAPLFVIHGGPGFLSMPREICDLPDERPVIFYDQLGCGRSDRPADTSCYTVEHYVEELETVRKALVISAISADSTHGRMTFCRHWAK